MMLSQFKPDVFIFKNPECSCLDKGMFLDYIFCYSKRKEKNRVLADNHIVLFQVFKLNKYFRQVSESYQIFLEPRST